MQRECLKCSHVNAASNGSDTEPCPQCGAIYSKVEDAVSAKQAKPANEHKLLMQFALYAIILFAVAIGLWMLKQHNAAAEKDRAQRTQLFQQAEQGRQNREVAQQAAVREQRAQDAVAARRIFIGMTAAEARSAWGEPSKINRTTSANGHTEQWVFYRGRSNTDYVYLRNDVVTSIQTSN